MGVTVPLYFDTVGGALTMLPTGRVKVLATSGAKRSPPMPSVPTFVELGHKDVIASAWFSYNAPAKTAGRRWSTSCGPNS
jgi:tripartite-type tricarboxylate transporter receptor subunit TctC